MNLLIVSHVTHYRWEGRLFALAPYAREIDIWAQLFDSVRIAAPLLNERPPSDCVPFVGNIEMAPQKLVGGYGLMAKIRVALALPQLIFGLCRAMRKADAIHVRCPGNLGILGLLLAPLFSRRLIAKYAGLWAADPTEPPTFRLQRALLCSRWWRGPVTVYTSEPPENRNIVPFYTTAMSDDHVARGRLSARRPRPGVPLRVLFVGRLSPYKAIDTVIEAVAKVRENGHQVRCTVVGDGPYRSELDALVDRLSAQDIVTILPGMPFEDILGLYETHDVQVLVSAWEGWGKATIEAMAFGLISIGADVAVRRQIFAEGRGIAVPPADTAALARELERIVLHPANYDAMRARACEYASQFSLEGLRESLRKTMLEHWGETELSGPVASAQREPEYETR